MNEAQDRAKMIADTIACLKYGWKIEKIGEAGGSMILCGPFPIHMRWYYFCDNGGEFNVGLINDHDAMRPVPYTNHHLMLDGGTMAYRIAMVLHGEAIDYSWRGEFLLDSIKELRQAA